MEKKRFVDLPVRERFKKIIFESDISFTLFLCGLGLIAWGIFGTLKVHGIIPSDPKFNVIFESNFIEHMKVLLINHTLIGITMISVAVMRYPVAFSMLLSSWMVFTWGYVFLNVGITIPGDFTDKASSLVFIGIGLAIFQRTKRIEERRRK